MTEPDWIYGGGTYYVGAACLPMESRVARLGVKGVLQQVTAAGEVIVTVQLHRGLRGWPARRWIKRHPLQLTFQIFRPEWGEWRTQIGKVKI